MTSMPINIPAVFVSAPVVAAGTSGAIVKVGKMVASGVAVGAGVKKIISGVGVGVEVGFWVGLAVARTVGVGVATQPQVKSVGQSGFRQKPEVAPSSMKQKRLTLQL